MNYRELANAIRKEDSIKAIGLLKDGRLTPMPDVTNAMKGLDPAKHDVMDTKIRPDKKVKKDSGDGYDDEDMYVDSNGEEKYVGSRHKIVKVERISIALQRLIVERAVSFSFGIPVEYTANTSTKAEKALFKSAKAVIKKVKMRSVDRKIARAMFSTTEVAEYWYPVEGKNSKYGFDSDFKLKVAIFSPANGDELYPYFDDSGDMIAFSRQYSITDKDGIEHTFFETYTHEYTYRWAQQQNGDWELVHFSEQAIGKIPIVYGCQERPEWEDVDSLISRLEFLLSNFADTNDYHAAPKIFCTGTIRGWADKGDSGAVITGDEGATMDYVSWQQAPEAVKLEIETLLKLIYTITQTPDISFDNVKGIGAISGTALELLFMDAHLKVQTKSEIFDEYLQRRMSIISKYLAKFNGSEDYAKASDTIDIEGSIKPYTLKDASTKIANATSATGGKAVASRETAIRMVGIVDDVDQELKKIEEEENAAMSGDIFGQDPYNVPNPQAREE